MGRFKKKKTVIDVCDYVQDSVVTSDVTETEPLVRRTGGDLATIFNNDVDETGFGKEVSAWRENISKNNPYIKHGFGRKADDFEIEDDDQGSDVFDSSTDSMANLETLSQSLDEKYDPEAESNKWDKELEEEIGDAPINNEFHRQYIDKCIVDNSVLRLGTSASIDEIKEQSKSKLSKYHKNKNYETEFDLDEAINDSILMIETQKSEEKKLIN